MTKPHVPRISTTSTTGKVRGGGEGAGTKRCKIRLLTGLSRGYPQMFFNVSRLRKRVEALEEQVLLLTKHRDVLNEALDSLLQAHRSLRGRVYAAGLHKSPLKKSDEDEEVESNLRSISDRDELRRLSGFRPGRPMAHKE